MMIMPFIGKCRECLLEPHFLVFRFRMHTAFLIIGISVDIFASLLAIKGVKDCFSSTIFLIVKMHFFPFLNPMHTLTIEGTKKRKLDSIGTYS